MRYLYIALVLLLHLMTCQISDASVRHYVFFGQDRQQLRTLDVFLKTKQFEGAQISYTWRMLEAQKDRYNFQPIKDDLKFLAEHHKKLWIQLQDLSFMPDRRNVPQYLIDGPKYHGGADKQFSFEGDDESKAKVAGWVARRWDPDVRERFHKLLQALGKEVDGKVAGINLTESAVEFGSKGGLYPKGFTPPVYRDAVILNMKALKKAFPKSVAMQYANFMPVEWLPDDDKGYLKSVYKAAIQAKVGVGGPDLLPQRRGQRAHSYPLITAAHGRVPTGIAVQEGNYSAIDSETGRPLSVTQLFDYAAEELKVDFIFWCTEEPYFSRDVAAFVSKQPKS